MAQPTLSEQVGELERELGKQLFFRQGRREVTLTEAGWSAEEIAGLIPRALMLCVA